LGSQPNIHYVLVFEHKGDAVGVTLRHPHGHGCGDAHSRSAERHRADKPLLPSLCFPGEFLAESNRAQQREHLGLLLKRGGTGILETGAAALLLIENVAGRLWGSCGELDLLVELAGEVPGVLGSRMTGADFGGCTTARVRQTSLPA